MGFMANMKANAASAQYQRGNQAEAMKLFQEAYEKGLTNAKPLLTYAILLIREEEYAKAIDVLRKAEKAPDMSKDGRTQMLVHYAIAKWKLGDMNRCMEVMQELYRKGANGYLYGTMGFLLIEAGDAEEALRFNQEAVEYDDEDPIFLDNLAQVYYRMLNDKATAKPLFEKALKLKPAAIDSNYFLALYDIEEGNTEAAAEKLKTSLEGRFSPLNYVTHDMAQAKLDELPGGNASATGEDAAQ